MDPEGRFLVTGSSDKTVRIWSASDGKFLRTIRMPAGPDNIGKIYTVAISPDGETIAAGVYARSNHGQPIYLFNRSTGNLIKSIWGLSAFVTKLTFSPDGRYLAAGLGRGGGLRVFAHDRDWSEAFSVAGEEDTFGVSFAADGRLATSSAGGKIRLYDANFKLIASADAPSGRNPYGIAFSPDGVSLAVGYHDLPAVDILDGHNLASLPGPDLNGLNNGFLEVVTWSADGQTLFASGGFEIAGKRLVLAWDEAGHGARRGLSAACGEEDNTTTELLSKATGELLVVKYNPCLTLLSRSGEVIWAVDPPIADFRGRQNTLSVSGDATTIDLGHKVFGKSPLRFDLRARTLSEEPPKDGRTVPAKHDGIRIDHWWQSTAPTVNGAPIKLGPFERALSFAIHPDGQRFVLGADLTLRALDAEGKQLWRRTVPGAAWDVNIAADGRLVVAAHNDGTIRWYRMDDGRELLAFQMLKDKKNWVTWTPEGFYDATPGAFGVLRWHINHGPDSAAEAIPIYLIPKLKRPDALPLVLQELETSRALGIADLAAARFDVQRITGAAIAPGARLHVLAIGISDYGDKAKDLRLKFASKDANDVASALLATQGGEFNKNGGLYTDVRFQYLSDEKADRAGIFGALEALKNNMANGVDQDLAVVLFSGHGVTIDNHFYLLPYGVDARTPARLKASAISATEFHDEIEQVASYGRVLVLLDACHSGAATADGFKLSSNADFLRSLISASNVTVLTSSTANEFSREDQNWGNGAFTKILMEALGHDADENHDGVISMSELTRYIATRVPILTENAQHPGMDQRFEGAIFVAGP
jgi:WD40 repeat protein